MNRAHWTFRTATREDAKHLSNPLAAYCSECRGWRPLVYVNPKLCRECAKEVLRAEVIQEALVAKREAK